MLCRLFVSFLCIASAAAVIAQETVSKPSLLRYTAPAGFKRDDARNPQGGISFWAPFKDGFAANIGIVNANAGGQTIQKIAGDVVKQLGGAPGVKVLSHGATKLGGRDGYYIESTRVQGNLTLGVYMVLSINKGTMVGFHALDIKSRSAGTFKKFKDSLKSFAWQN